MVSQQVEKHIRSHHKQFLASKDSNVSKLTEMRLYKLLNSSGNNWR